MQCPLKELCDEQRRDISWELDRLSVLSPSVIAQDPEVRDFISTKHEAFAGTTSTELAQEVDIVDQALGVVSKEDITDGDKQRGLLLILQKQKSLFHRAGQLAAQNCSRGVTCSESSKTGKMVWCNSVYQNHVPNFPNKRRIS